MMFSLSLLASCDDGRQNAYIMSANTPKHRYFARPIVSCATLLLLWYSSYNYNEVQNHTPLTLLSKYITSTNTPMTRYRFFNDPATTAAHYGTRRITNTMCSTTPLQPGLVNSAVSQQQNGSSFSASSLPKGGSDDTSYLAPSLHLPATEQKIDREELVRKEIIAP